MLYLHNILGGVWFVEETFAANYLPLVTSYLTTPIALTGHPRNALQEEERTGDNSVQFAAVKNGAYQDRKSTRRPAMSTVLMPISR